jgi:hypothetical protein
LAGAEESSAPTAEQRSLFDSLLGDPLTLFQDVLDHPQDYDESLPVLLQEVIQGSKKLDELSDDDRRRLDDAVLVFVDPVPAAAPPDPPPDSPAPTPPGPKRPTPNRTTPIERVLAEHSTPTVPAGPPNIPEAPPTFWWKKSGKKDQ